MDIDIEPISTESAVSLRILSQALPVDEIEKVTLVSVDHDCLGYREVVNLVTTFTRAHSVTIETEGSATGYLWRSLASYPHISVILKCRGLDCLRKALPFIEAGGSAHCLLSSECKDIYGSVRDYARKVGYKSCRVMERKKKEAYTCCFSKNNLFIDSYMQVFPCRSQGIMLNEVEGYRDLLIRHGIRHVTLRKSRNLYKVMQSPVMTDFRRKHNKLSHVCEDICPNRNLLCREEKFNDHTWRPLPTIQEDSGGSSVLEEAGTEWERQ